MVVAVKESRAAYLRGWRARKRGDLLPFQKAFVAALTRKEKAPDILGLSCPRGNGKSWLCGQLIARSLTPGDVLHEDAVENILVSSSRNQAKIVLEFARESLGDTPAFAGRILALFIRHRGQGCESSRLTVDAHWASAHTSD